MPVGPSGGVLLHRMRTKVLRYFVDAGGFVRSSG
jgi:hypothetical protein